MGKQSLSIAVAVALGTFTAAPAIAQDDIFDQPELTGMFSISVPLDDPRPKYLRDGTQLGFSMGFARPQLANDFEYQPEQFQQMRFRPISALADIKFDLDKNNWKTFRIGGVDSLQYERVIHADGTETTEPSGFGGFSTGAIVAGVVVGVVVAVKANDDDDDDVPASSNGGGFGGGI